MELVRFKWQRMAFHHQVGNLHWSRLVHCTTYIVFSANHLLNQNQPNLCANLIWNANLADGPPERLFAGQPSVLELKVDQLVEGPFELGPTARHIDRSHWSIGCRRRRRRRLVSI